MKPSRTPCFFSKSSFSRSRSAMTAVMSTSLKVVSMAAVFCASFRRLAMVWRSRVMRTRSSRSARRRGPAGRRAWRRRRGGRAWADRERPARRPWWRGRPCRWAGSPAAATPFSSASLRTAGPEAARLAPTARRRRRPVPGGGRGRRRSRGRRAGAGGRRGWRCSAAAPASMWQSTPPTWTVAPSRHGQVDDGAGHARVDLDRHLVGLELDQRLVDRHRVARLHQPLGDGRLGDRFAQRRDLDLDGHD